VSGKAERDLPSIIDGTYSWWVYYDAGEIYIHIYISGERDGWVAEYQTAKKRLVGQWVVVGEG
jgi:hypothetical protein